MAEIDAMSISTHFRELQQEKKKLENKFEHLKLRRKDLETKHETVAKKNLLLHQKNDNMTRTVNVAKMKVQETQLQVDKLQRMNDELQKVVSEVKQKIEDEETDKENMFNAFLEKYDELGDSFRNAKVYYVDESLHVEEEKWKSSCDKKKVKVQQTEEVIKTVSDRLSNMQLQGVDKVPEEKPPRSLWQQYNENKDILSSVLEESKQQVTHSLQHLSDRTSKSTQSLKELDDKLSHLKQEIAK